MICFDSSKYQTYDRHQSSRLRVFFLTWTLNVFYCIVIYTNNVRRRELFRRTNMKDNNITDKFEKIYDLESDSIFRFCLVRVSNREQALDITQETFLRFWQSLAKDEEVRNDRAFLFTIAHRLIIDWYRKKKSISLDVLMHKETEEGEADYDLVDEKTLDSLDIEAEGRYLLDKLSKLPSGYQHPVYLRFVEGLSPPEIAEVLGISTNAASVRINRGLSELRKITGYNNDKD